MTTLRLRSDHSVGVRPADLDPNLALLPLPSMAVTAVPADPMASDGGSGYRGRVHELTGWNRLRDRYRNKGTAFTAAERDRFRLHGLLPPVVETLEQQLDRVRIEFDTKGTDLGRHIFLRLLQERNSVLYYSFITRYLEEMLPIVYTPTVGLACQEWSRIYRQEHGLYLSWPERHRVGEMLANALGGRDDRHHRGQRR